jgi:hypothetical protein
MNSWSALAMLVLATVLANSSGHARDLLTPVEKRVYHACLKAAWVYDYCRSRPFGYLWDVDAAFQECLLANRAPRISAPGVWWYGTDARQACWNEATAGHR